MGRQFADTNSCYHLIVTDLILKSLMLILRITFGLNSIIVLFISSFDTNAT